MSRSPSRIDPDVGVSSPATIRSVVVLPHPDGPSSAKKDPLGMSRSRDRTAVKAANSLVRLRIRNPSKGRPSSPGPSPRVFLGTWVSAACDIGPLSFVLLLLLVVEGHEGERTLQVVLGGEDQLVVDQRLVDLLHRLLGTLDRTDVVHVRR